MIGNATRLQIQRWLYPLLVLLIITSWLIYMFAANGWQLFTSLWPLSVTMLFGSFIAGATPQGGAAVAFPVFTKVFQMPASDARTFGLMIQAVGMSVAGLTIWLRRVKILPRVLIWVTVGGAFGMILGTYTLIMPNPYPKILFSLSMAAFGVALIISRWLLNWSPCDCLPDWNWQHSSLFVIIGIIGGILAAHTGAGADSLTFVVLTLAFGIHEKVSTPTTIIIMALNSLFGFALHGIVVQDIGLAWNYWLVCLPIVILGAPLGALALSKVSRDTLIKGILFLILVELVSTLILIPFTGLMVWVTAVSIIICTLCFTCMLYYRHHWLPAVGD